MLKIAEYSCACDALKDKIKRSLRDAGVQYDNRASEDDTVRIVFAGQYSAGKSTISLTRQLLLPIFLCS